MPVEAISLFELTKNIQQKLWEAFPETFWVIAEISDYKVNRSGHCYLELIEKQESSESIIAKSRATIWSNVFRMIRPYFETTTGRSLSAGLKILVNVAVEFHEVYGLSLNILDIEPEYTLGDLARQKAETLARLEKEGVIHMNKSLSLTTVPQVIALITSETAAGYEDFINQLKSNPYGYKFYIKLFPAVMQGDEAENSIITALENIYSFGHFFDAVVIIRGGGAKSDLHCFNNYWLAFHVAQFPLPVLTGIGHEQDETVLDIVAHTKLKTPTAVAEFLINRAAEFEEKIMDARNSLAYLVNEKILHQHYLLEQVSKHLPTLVNNRFLIKENQLRVIGHRFDILSKKYFIINKQIAQNYFSRLRYTAKNLIYSHRHTVSRLQENSNKTILNFLKFRKHQLEMYHKSNQYLDPVNILDRGYTLTFFNHQIIKEPTLLKEGDIIETKMRKGGVESRVQKIKK